MVHPLYLVFLASAGAFFWAVAASSMVGAVAAYVSAGVALRVYEQQKPAVERPYWGEIPFLLTILLWPLRVRSAVYEYFWRLKRPGRFRVLGGGLIITPEELPDGRHFDHFQLRKGDSKTIEFDSWTQAVTFARERAAESGEIVHVGDSGRLTRQKFGGISYAMYWVLPSGEIKKAPY